MKNLEEMIKLINDKYPQMRAVPATDFYSDKEEGVNRIWFRQEGAQIDGHQVHDEYQTDGALYEITTLRVFHDFLKSHGWYSQPYDCGTLMADMDDIVGRKVKHKTMNYPEATCFGITDGFANVRCDNGQGNDNWILEDVELVEK